MWLVDDIQPVAAFLQTPISAGVGAQPRLVDWVAAPLAPPGSTRVVHADGDGFAVQDGDGAAVVRVAPDGGVRIHPAAGLTLRATHNGDLWLTGDASVTIPVQGAGEPSSPPLPLEGGLLVAVDPDGGRREITVDRPIATITVDPRGLMITVPEERVSVDESDRARGGYGFSTVLLDWGSRSPRLRVADLPAIPKPRHTTRFWWWHDRDLDRVRTSGPAGIGLLWAAGRVRIGSRTGRDHPVLVTGHDPVTLAERVRVDLGIGNVVDVSVVDPEMWLAVARGRWVEFVHPVEVVAVTAAGRTRVVIDADTVDITDRCRPLIAQDEDTRIGYPTRERDQLGDLQAYWHSAGEAATPLAEGMTDAVVAVRGEWPDTVLQITCRHPSRPGLLLRRRIPLFDEFGRPTPTPYAAIYLMEDLDCGLIPSADDAQHGILDI